MQMQSKNTGTKRMNRAAPFFYEKCKHEEEWWTIVSDGGEDDVNRKGTENIEDVCRGLYTETFMVQGISTGQESRIEELGATVERYGTKQGNVKENGGRDDVNEDVGNESMVRKRGRLGRPRGTGKCNGMSEDEVGNPEDRTIERQTR